MKPRLLLAAACALGFSSLAVAEGSKPHWSYQGHGSAAHWAELDEAFKTCKLGKFQSPINVVTQSVEKSADAKPIGFAYAAGAGDVVNNGHTIQVDLASGGAITLDGVEYKLVQFHFHTPSEEKIDGKPYPLVAHLVHKSAQGQLAVVAVLFKTGKENAALKPVFDHLPVKAGEHFKLEGAINPADLLPVANPAYYAFKGSLTTPPCSEEVTWHVLKTPVEISLAQLASFKKRYAMNARPVQPLNGRKVMVVGS